MKPPAKLSLILGMDAHYVQPKLVEQFSDKHGFLGLYACSLSNTLITCENRIVPNSPEEETRALAQHTNSFGVTTEDASDLEEDNLSSLPSTTLFHSALQEDCQTAVRLEPRSPTLQFQEDKYIDVPTTHIKTAARTASPRTPRATSANHPFQTPTMATAAPSRLH